MLAELGLGYVIRFRGNIVVADADGTRKPAKDWVPPNGRARVFRAAHVTRTRALVPTVVCVKARGMKDPWCLAASSETESGASIISRRSSWWVNLVQQDLKRQGLGSLESPSW